MLILNLKLNLHVRVLCMCMKIAHGNQTGVYTVLAKHSQGLPAASLCACPPSAAPWGSHTAISTWAPVIAHTCRSQSS
jgi:hypothetical protein